MIRSNPHRGMGVGDGTAYPALWDVARPFGALSAGGSAFLELPILTRPVLAVRAGGRKLVGEFPYFDGAYLGGTHTLRTFHHASLAGDASLYAGTELRAPIARVPLVLPLDVGAIGFVDAGRVYWDGASPGGWHTVAGGGFWIGLVNPALSVRILATNRAQRRFLLGAGMSY